ncbi:MAG TPA: hypothetical protein DCY94_02725, partial [Firmicutes bacterium]|nr:hypothetical protein [Bacillota bacterium]
LKMISPFMPYVSDEIYDMLPFRDSEAIMISEYPKYNREHEYETDTVDDMLEFIKLFRTFKLENGVGKEFFVESKTDADYTIIDNLLRLSGNRISNREFNASYEVIYKNYCLTVHYNKDIEGEADVLKKRIEELENAISRREKLLSNENYVAKAPANIVETERNKLKEEKE